MSEDNAEKLISWAVKVTKSEKELLKSYLKQIRWEEANDQRFEKELESNRRRFKINKFDVSGNEFKDWQDYQIITFLAIEPSGHLFNSYKMRNSLGAYGNTCKEAIKNLSKKYILDDDLFDIP